MARTLIRGNTQIMDLTITNEQIDATAGIQLTKIENGEFLLVADGTTGAAGDLNMGGFKVINAAPGTDPDDLVTKAQLDAVSAGLDPKESCRLATTANIDLATGGLLTIDNVQTVAGDRILVKDQTVTSENGIYDAAAGAWVRSLDFDGNPGNEVSGGAFSFIEHGTDYAGSGWVVVADGDIVVGTDPIVWTLFSSSGAYTGGGGITVIGGVISADTDVSLSITEGSGTQLGIADGGVLTVHIAADAVDRTKINADVAGLGIVQAVGGELDVNVASAGGLEIVADAVQVKIDGTTLSTSAAGIKVADGGIDSGQIAIGAIDSTHLSEELLDGLGSGLAGFGLSYDSILNTLNVNVDNTTLEITADVLNIKAGGVGTTELADAAVTFAKIDTAMFGTGLSIDATSVFVDSGVFLSLDDIITRESLSAQVDGSTAIFTLANVPAGATEHIYLNGILMDEGAANDYTISGNTITFTFVPRYHPQPAKRDKILVSYIKG